MVIHDVIKKGIDIALVDGAISTVLLQERLSHRRSTVNGEDDDAHRIVGTLFKDELAVAEDHDFVAGVAGVAGVNFGHENVPFVMVVVVVDRTNIPPKTNMSNGYCQKTNNIVDLRVK